MKRWQDGVNVIVGLWVLISPWALGFSTTPVATWTTALLGAAIVVLAGSAAFVPKVWEEAIAIVLGVAVLVSPWVLGLSAASNAAASAVVAGLLVMALGIWAVANDPGLFAWPPKRPKTPCTLLTIYPADASGAPRRVARAARLGLVRASTCLGIPTKTTPQRSVYVGPAT
jgi:hypothetical protein